ncbi:transcriptional regulator [Liquorilactobacillus sucicola DSM 21376 = JCM 15457]|uniref:AraC family transcriptional regulator n=2 Tax=Liquorilactobacillus sucicola TaxID=519050 RepID=A0A023CWS0_9LACO|nr:helix-turn-helix domain-containing protein [Liquorilactobacillus sucicola]AJA34347.1 transcriptional regulator [Liquorilactobacillus sucicola]KRN06871.1 AraC family transcriptional regulator [Liquorilactobacillus sucicola DSM 21376 = JCM 15457]GAJ26348.1 transcriptional regulator [Liquorilactobacillus sucicola DSM 21376 = JCM 15457]
MNQRVLNMLHTLNSLEKKQKKDACYLEEMPVKAFSKDLSEKKKIKVLNNYFFRNKDIYVSKHNRFAPYPLHAHTFLEINYMLEGNADQVVNGKPIFLHRGDLLVLDVGAEHSIGTLGERDLLINILFRNSNINIDFLKDLRRSRSVLYDFLLKSPIKANEKQNYLVFRTAKNNKIAQIMDEIIEEYFLKKEFSDTIIKSYLHILVTNLVRDYQIVDQQPQSKTRKIVIEILDEIDKNYSTITLQKVANMFGYNKNYLSNLFKKEVNKSFSEVVIQKKMTQAHTLIMSTSLPISKIVEAVGISNKSFFYKKYYDFYKEKPLADRQQNLINI